MNDKLQVKALNGELIWNTPIIDLIEQTCYHISFESSSIEVFLSGGELGEGIEFIRATIGKYELSTINSSYFRQITFELITPETEVRNIIRTWSDKHITSVLKGNELTISYNGTNCTLPSKSQLIASNENTNLNNTKTWDIGIQEIRNLLKSEYRFYSYDFHYLNTYNYGWLELKSIELIGLKDLQFRAHFDYNINSITHIETIIGNTLIEYQNIKRHLISNYGVPTNIESEEVESAFKNDIWQTNNIEIKLHSAYIPRSEPEQIRYELEIKKYSA